MGAIRPAEEVKREIIKRYNSEPEGWHIFVGRSPDGYYSMMASHGSERWIVKEQPLSPFESVGLGLALEGEEREKAPGPSSYRFGFRPLTEDQAKTMLGAMEGRGNLDRVLKTILKTRPVPLEAIKTPAAIQGPILHSSNPLELISERQRKLDRELGEELEKKLISRYSYRLGMYL